MGDKDKVEKTLEAFNDVFADIVNGLLFDGEQVVSEEDLVDQTPYSYYKEAGEIRGQERDVAKRWEKGGVTFSCIGIENQTSPDPDMPMRVIAYDAAVYKRQLAADTNRHYPVVSLVLYLGYRQRWNGPLQLKRCLDVPRVLEQYVSNYTINVFPIAWLTREQVNYFRSDFRVVADYYVQKRETGGRYEPDPQTLRHAREVMHYLSVMERDDWFERVYNEMRVQNPNKEEYSMCEVVERFMEQGREQERQRMSGIIERSVEQAREQERQRLSEVVESYIEQGREQERQRMSKVVARERTDGILEERRRNVRALKAAGQTQEQIAGLLQLDVQAVQELLADDAE